MAVAEGASRAVLVICNGGFEGMRYALSNEETLIGRNPNTDITLLDESISREHAIVIFDLDLITDDPGAGFTFDLVFGNSTVGSGPPIGSAPVPEPATGFIVLVPWIGQAASWRRRGRRAVSKCAS